MDASGMGRDAAMCGLDVATLRLVHVECVDRDFDFADLDHRLAMLVRAQSRDVTTSPRSLPAREQFGARGSRPSGRCARNVPGRRHRVLPEVLLQLESLIACVRPDTL